MKFVSYLLSKKLSILIWLDLILINYTLDIYVIGYKTVIKSKNFQKFVFPCLNRRVKFKDTSGVLYSMRKCNTAK